MSDAQNSLVGFAVLRANYNVNAPNYLDNFQSFALDVLTRSHPTAVDAHTTSTAIGEQFGLVVPDLVVAKILQGLRRSNLATGDRFGYTATDKALRQATSLTSKIQRYSRQQGELASKFADYLRADYPDHPGLLDQDPAEELSRYLQLHAVPLLAQSMFGATSSAPDLAPGFGYVISRFIAHLAQRDQVGFGYVEDAAKGAILAAVLTLDTSSFNQSLKSLTIYLDMPLLIDLLGYHGEASGRATRQLVELAGNLGASVYAFEHSIRELENVLSAAEAWLKNGRSDGTLRTVTHFQDQGMSAADVAIERERVSSALRVAGVRVRAKPDDYAKYGLDEGQLEATLQEYVHYRNDGARRFDVDSISAVHRLREGRSPNKLEQCRYVLATGNSEIVRAAQRIQGEHHEWPLVMTETALAALLWVRSPTGVDDLPRTLLLATAYAGMQPDPRLWVKYIEEVANLEKRGHLNPEDAMILRSTAVARSALMEETLGDDQEIASDAPLVVLKRVKDELSKPLADEVASITELERLAREKADREVENNADLASQVETLVARLGSAALHIEVTDKARDAKIRAAAERRAIISVRAYAAAIATALAMFSSLSIWYQPWAGTIPAWAKIASGGSAVVLVIVATVRAFLPGTITDWFARPLHAKLADRYERRVRESAQLTRGPAQEL